jgi:hypothetical protein
VMSADVGRFENKGVEVSNLNSLATPPGDMGGVGRDMADTGMGGGRLGVDNGLLGLARYMNDSLLAVEQSALRWVSSGKHSTLPLKLYPCPQTYQLILYPFVRTHTPGPVPIMSSATLEARAAVTPSVSHRRARDRRVVGWCCHTRRYSWTHFFCPLKHDA